MAILWFSNETPNRHGQGGQRRQYFQIGCLVAHGIDVTVASLAGDQDDESIRGIADVRRLNLMIKGRPLRPSGVTEAVRLARSRQWDGVVVAHGESWPIGRRIAQLSKAPALVDLHNVYSAWYADADDRNLHHEYALLEARVLREAQCVAVCSEREAARLPKVESARVVVMGHGIDPEEWQIGPRSDFRRVVKLFGNWDWAPNRDGLRWFLESVWPYVRSREPSATCEIAGTCRWLTKPPDGVSLIGWVPSVNGFVSDAAVVAVPVQGGVGAPVKYAEALASGVPVAATPEAAHGLSCRGGLVSDDAEVWSDWVVDVLDKAASHRRASRDVRQDVLHRFTWAQQSRPLIDWVNEVQDIRQARR